VDEVTELREVDDVREGIEGECSSRLKGESMIQRLVRDQDALYITGHSCCLSATHRFPRWELNAEKDRVIWGRPRLGGVRGEGRLGGEVLANESLSSTLFSQLRILSQSGLLILELCLIWRSSQEFGDVLTIFVHKHFTA
jgi:hypothetical protein